MNNIQNWLYSVVYPHIFQYADKIFTEHNFVNKGDVWHSNTYLDGSLHKRKDKVWISKDAPYCINEQGGEYLNFFNYFKKYRNMSDKQVIEYFKEITESLPDYSNKLSNAYTRQFSKPSVSFSEYKKENCYHNPKDSIQMFDSLKFPVAINTKILNKNISIDTGETDNFNYLTKYFTNAYLSKEQLMTHITMGHPVIFGHFRQNWNEEYINSIKKANWLYSKMFALDIEDSISLEEAFEKEDTRKSLFIYTTSRHTKLKNRFRIVFDMKGILSNVTQYSYVVKKYIDKYDADVACSNVNRAFYGNDDAIVYVYDNNSESFVNYLEVKNV
jgi:hypothetical protein